MYVCVCVHARACVCVYVRERERERERERAERERGRWGGVAGGGGGGGLEKGRDYGVRLCYESDGVWQDLGQHDGQLPEQCVFIVWEARKGIKCLLKILLYIQPLNL